ncbi:MAG: 30S ribosomal protein S21 [Mollicutes bacterium]|nr:30S ribosomal protein S21 [Mollicutes bacterium]
MTKVIVRNNNVEGALKNFKQKIARDGLLKEIKEREHYSKPGVRKRKAQQEARVRSNKAKKDTIRNSRKKY